MFEWHATLDLYSTSPWFSCLIQLQSTTTVGWALPLTMAICHAGPELIERLQNRSKMILTVLKFWGCCSTAFDGSLHAPTLSSVVIICLLMMMLSVGPALKPDAKGWTMLYYSTRPSLSSTVSCFWQRSTKEIGCLSQTQANHGPRPPGRSGYLDTSDLATSDLAISPSSSKGCSEKPIGIVAFMVFDHGKVRVPEGMTAI